MREIAKILKRSVSTISEEIKRNSVKRKYEPNKAHQKAYAKRKYGKYQPMKIIENKNLRKLIEEMLYGGQSPENIAGRITNYEKHLPSISKDSVYRFIKSIYGRKIEAHRHKTKKRRKKRCAKNKKIDNRTFIDKRPKIINKRKRLGDAEADFIVSGKNGKGILLVIIERKTRIYFLEKILDLRLKNIHRAFKKIKKRFSEMVTITTDNDLLLQKHKMLEKELSVKIYFCHPYHSWEKGAVENTNKNIRKYISKGSDISKYPKKFIKQVEEKINSRYLKCLNYLTPKECFLREKEKSANSALNKIKKYGV